MYICLIKVSAYKHINHAFVKHFVLFLQCASICPYVLVCLLLFLFCLVYPTQTLRLTILLYLLAINYIFTISKPYVNNISSCPNCSTGLLFQNIIS